MFCVPELAGRQPCPVNGFRGYSGPRDITHVLHPMPGSRLPQRTLCLVYFRSAAWLTGVWSVIRP